MQFIIDELKRLKVEEYLYDILYINNAAQYSIEWGMNYITFSKSKRLRPLLLLESNLVFNEVDNDSYILGCAIELIHTYSLVHDDLPCMDDDDLRRGVKTLHKIKNEGYAVLVGDALLTRAFNILSRFSKTDKINKILSEYSDKSGYKRLINGQFLDLEGENNRLTLEQMTEINKHKTSSMFELALFSGALNAGVSEEQINRMINFGEILGFLFQLKDDLLDVTGDAVKMGKSPGSDEKNNKSSIPLIIGLKKSEELLNEYKESLYKLIQEFPSNKDFFEKLVDFIVTREA